jgi:hypothetical protein
MEGAMAKRSLNPFPRRPAAQEARRDSLRRLARAGAPVRNAASAHFDAWALSALGSAVAFVLWIVLR